jgi:hypothetical protein
VHRHSPHPARNPTPTVGHGTAFDVVPESEIAANDGVRRLHDTLGVMAGRSASSSQSPPFVQHVDRLIGPHLHQRSQPCLVSRFGHVIRDGVGYTTL